MSEYTDLLHLDNRGENILQESDEETSLKSIVGKVKAEALKKIRQGVTGIIPSVYKSVAQFTPVYKVMITVPTLKGALGSRTVVPYRYVLADTSRPTINFLSDHDSPVVGMWVDQSDLSEPDKAIILIQNPVTIIDNIFEQDMLEFHQFGVRNWLDVWIGYVPATLSNIISLGNVLGATFAGTMAKAPFTIPDPFMFGNDSHVFSGPIVSIKRTVDATGDRLQIIGFSPAMILKQVETREFKLDSESEPSVFKCINDVANAVFPIDIKKIGDTDNYDKFPMGRFPFYMFSGGGSKIRVVPVNEGFHWGPSLPLWSEQIKDHDLVGTKLMANKLQITLEGESTLYDILFSDLTTAAYTQLGRLYASIHRSKGKDHPEWAFVDGEGHPGVFIKYAFAHELSGIRRMVEKEKAYPPSHIQSLTLGRDCREFEGGVEYGTVFNIRKFMVKVDGGDGKNAIMHFPIDFLKGEVGGTVPPPLTTDPYDKHIKLWRALQYDIEVYGPSTSPLEKWIWGEGGGPIKLAKKGVAGFIARSMRDTYFTGMSGSVFAVGSPSLQPGRILELTDGRGQLSQYTPSELAKRGISIVAKSLKKDVGAGEPATPKMFRIKNMDKDFYIWKVRHYLGVGSGYVSKVYYTEERNRSWQKYTESIDNIIRKAMMQSKMTMAGAGRL